MIGGPLIGLQEALTQQAVIQRDQATADEFGGKGARNWETVATVPCRMWWGTGKNISRLGTLAQSPERTVEVDVMAMIVPLGSDVASHDRIARVLDGNGDLFVEGPFEVFDVAVFETQIELNCRRVN